MLRQVLLSVTLVFLSKSLPLSPRQISFAVLSSASTTSNRKKKIIYWGLISCKRHKKLPEITLQARTLCKWERAEATGRELMFSLSWGFAGRLNPPGDNHSFLAWPLVMTQTHHYNYILSEGSYGLFHPWGSVQSERTTWNEATFLYMT